MKKFQRPFINLGFSSILMVFITVCFATFAALSVLTAHSDYKLSSKFADKTTAYYQADMVARNIACEIEQNLYRLYSTVYHENDFFEELTLELLLENVPEGATDIEFFSEDNSACINYAVTISEVQTLHVSLEILYPASGNDTLLKINRWQNVTEILYTEESEDPLPLLGTD